MNARHPAVLDHHFGPEARDPRNRQFRVGLIQAPQKLGRAKWWKGGPVLDQGPTGHCGGFGAADEAAASPVRVRPISDSWAHAFYYEIKDRQLDPFGREDGTSVQAVMRLGQLRGLWHSYGWALNMTEFDQALEVGPVIVGTSWRTGMFTPDNEGLIVPTGADEGGHCYVFTGRRIDHPRWGSIRRLRNSWGHGWGVGGNAFMREDDVAEIVFGNDGEAAVPIQRELPRAS